MSRWNKTSSNSKQKSDSRYIKQCNWIGRHQLGWQCLEVDQACKTIISLRALEWEPLVALEWGDLSFCVSKYLRVTRFALRNCVIREEASVWSIIFKTVNQPGKLNFLFFFSHSLRFAIRQLDQTRATAVLDVQNTVKDQKLGLFTLRALPAQGKTPLRPQRDVRPDATFLGLFCTSSSANRQPPLSFSKFDIRKINGAFEKQIRLISIFLICPALPV